MTNGGEKSPVTGYIVAILFGTVVLFLLIGYLAAWLYSKLEERWLSMIQTPNTVPNSQGESIQAVSIKTLKAITNDFNENNIIGQGGFGTVYKGELGEDTTVAIKRMKPGEIVGTSESATEFEAEIAVLKGANHRNLVSLAGYCLEENEKLIIYEYMPQGTLSRHLFSWKDQRLEPLSWNRRLLIALDVAKGIEYLHHSAHPNFIHRDLKPSNILLGNDIRAKVADFGLACLAPKDKASMEAKFGGTFGYVAPEFAVSGRVTTKVDVYSFGVILMELITGRKVLDDSQPEDRRYLVPWFQGLDRDLLHNAVDPTIDTNEGGTLVGIETVADLAIHCCARDPKNRPGMDHVITTLSSLADRWIPPVSDPEDIHGIDTGLTLLEALKRWQAHEDTSSSSSFPPHGFAASSTPVDVKMKGPMLEEGSSNKLS